MTLLVPPTKDAGKEIIEQDTFSTPSLGFHYFWHQRHDQPRTAPGQITCRHCKPLKKAGAHDLDTLVRKNSCLAALATVTAGAQHDVRRVVPCMASSGPSGLVLQEFFAGHGVISRGWRQAGEIALDEIELYEDPHRQRGRRPDHDLADPAVQQRYLAAIDQDQFNVEWIACPCTTFCDWNLQNSGARTFDNPLGKPTEKEANGNILSTFGAVAFEKALDRGHFPIAESSGISGRYPKQWHLPCWQRLLRRDDVQFIELDMCSFGLAPLDQQDGCHFYRHRTGLAFPRHPAFGAALMRQQWRAGGLVASRGEGEREGIDDGSSSDSYSEETPCSPTEGAGDDGDEDPLPEGNGVSEQGESEDVEEDIEVEVEVQVESPECAVDEPGGDSWWRDEARGFLWIEHRVPRRTMDPWDAWEILDNWRTKGNCEAPHKWWCGTTVFAFRGYDIGRHPPWEDTTDPGGGADPEGGSGDEDPEGEGDDCDDESGGPGDQGLEPGDNEPTEITTGEAQGAPDAQDEGDIDCLRAGGQGANELCEGTGAIDIYVEEEPEESVNDESTRGQVAQDEGDCGSLRGGGHVACAGSRVMASDKSKGTWTSFVDEGLSREAEEAAYHYMEVIDAIEDGEPDTWRQVRCAGDALLRSAGTVEQAAKALWIARECSHRNNLAGVDDTCLDDLLHPDLLEYLREVRRQGMPARFQGERVRIANRPHPRARANMQQVYRQLMKDVSKHRVLVVDSGHECLQWATSSPFEAVPKMLPNRALSAEVRLVHDQRGVNSGTHKDLHPPALQPLHEQIARRILFLKSRYPRVKVVLAKKDVAGAFRLLWLDPQDVELFGGDVGWEPWEMGAGGGKQEGDPLGLTMLYLVSSFGFSGSPGEWTVWGRATEELHRQHCPFEPRRDGVIHFDGKILVDDMVLVEPCLGLRPWISSEVYEWGVKKLLGEKAVNAEKDREEGQFCASQLIWGIYINADEKMSLPEARVSKGAYLLNNEQFNYGEKKLTLKDLQRFRGIATGWSAVVKGLKNELKAADRFLGGVDGGAIVTPARTNSEEDVERAWDDLWNLFEDCRWLCARSETWSEKFGGDIRELLPAMERLSLPGGRLSEAIFVTSDATLDLLAAIDWTNGVVCREAMKEMESWVARALEEEDSGVDRRMAIHLGEMLSFVAFACRVGHKWTGKIVVYGGDNRVVYHWICSRRSRVRAGKLLIRVLNLVEMRFRCQVLGGWWRTFHNEDADALTRLNDEEAEQMIQQRGWEKVDIRQSIHDALLDTERFGPCFLSRTDLEDKEEMMRLRELRVFRSIHRSPQQLEDLRILEWTAVERHVKDFAYYQKDGASGPIVVAATIGPDPKGLKLKAFWSFLQKEEYAVAVIEGPKDVAWEMLRETVEVDGLKVTIVEFLTSEFGELLVRRRQAMFLHRADVSEDEVEGWMARAVTAPSVGSILGRGAPENYVKYQRFEKAVGQGNHAMLPFVGAHVWFKDGGARVVVYRLCGPGRWPLAANDHAMEELYVVDKGAPSGTVRKVTKEELWRAQGRSSREWAELCEDLSPEQALRQGCAGTGRRTALGLLSVAAEIAAKEVNEYKAGMCVDLEDYKSLGQMLVWLRRWRRGDFARAVPERKAGGVGTSPVWLWGEDLWLQALEDMEVEENDKAAGRKASAAAHLKEAEKVVNLQPGLVGDTNIQAQVEEWLEEHMDGDKAKSTKRAYQSAWEKWTDWARRQGWLSPYLNYKDDAVINENKLLGYLGYLGWLGTSVASLKLAVFAIKDAHKRAGHGDATGKMHRLWIVLNSLERTAPKKPRRLGVTVPMLKWVGEHLEEGCNSFGELRIDCRMLKAALLTAWFYMLRAKEFADSSGVDPDMIVRGVDISLSSAGERVQGESYVEEMTLQFRKTKADQSGFGTCKTMLRTEVRHVCVVQAMVEFKEVAPRRFEGPEALLPLAQIGGASALFQATGEVEVVKRTGRWSSGAVHRYLHDSGDVVKGLSRKMANVNQYVHYT
eukprot:s4058_g8.t1